MVTQNPLGKHVFLDPESGGAPVTAAYILSFTSDVPINQELFVGVAQVTTNDPGGFFPFLTPAEQLADTHAIVTTGMGFGLGILSPDATQEVYEAGSVLLDNAGTVGVLTDDGTVEVINAYGTPGGSPITGPVQIAHIVLNGTTTLFVTGEIAVLGQGEVPIDETFIVPEPTLLLQLIPGVALLSLLTGWRARSFGGAAHRDHTVVPHDAKSN